MPLISLKLENAETKYKFKSSYILKDLLNDKNKDYEVSLRYISLTVENPVSQIDAENELKRSFFIHSNICKRQDLYIGSGLLNNPSSYEQILGIVDFKGLESDLTIPATCTRYRVINDNSYFTDMNIIKEEDITIELRSDDNTNLTLFDVDSEIIGFNIVLEYRIKK